MFLFSRKTKTPISTYSDSYRAPTSIKEVYKDPPLWAWEANKFVTRGLTQTAQRHVDPDALQKMLKCAVQDYSCKGSIPSHPYFPEKYWLCPEEGDPGSTFWELPVCVKELEEALVLSLESVSPCEHRPGMQCAVITPQPSYYPCPNLRWDTSHFKKTGGSQRNNYVVHPEFVSETYPDYHCW
ncbi:hypothetical protein JEQ12_008892 [Ovis aries]|uniref:Spermatid-specific manchette-related protein 1 n=1 Tax=Ovis aries TaxID=9940 RepID=A0A836AMJ3_SHEEP|nr:hypothetical protein JEQ12_008892 [Ovis aries]